MNPNDELKSKKGIGIVMGLFLGLIGLIIGLLLYPNETVERQTFIKGWLTAFLIGIGISVLFVIIYFFLIASYMPYY